MRVVKQTGWRGAFPCGEAGGRLHEEEHCNLWQRPQQATDPLWEAICCAGAAGHCWPAFALCWARFSSRGAFCMAFSTLKGCSLCSSSAPGRGSGMYPSWDEREDRIHPAPCSWCPQPRGDTARALPAGLAAPGGRGVLWAWLSPACFKPGPSSPAPLPLGGSNARGVLAGAAWGQDCSCAPD